MRRSPLRETEPRPRPAGVHTSAPPLLAALSPAQRRLVVALIDAERTSNVFRNTVTKAAATASTAAAASEVCREHTAPTA